MFEQFSIDIRTDAYGRNTFNNPQINLINPETIGELLSTDSFTHRATSPAWENKPSSYMVASADRSINPIQERMMATRAHATTVEVNVSHVAYMSHPKEAAKLIEKAATSARAGQ